MKFKDFLMKAKRKTFASRWAIPKGVFSDSRSYFFAEGGFEYLDEYRGVVNDKGSEIVSLDGEKIWSMDYAGGMNEGYERFSRKTFRFLKKCLRNSPEDFPVRGPKLHQKGKWIYENNWDGNLDSFEGKERIALDGEEVYSRKYSGGKICSEKSLDGLCETS